MEKKLIEVNKLNTTFQTIAGEIQAVRDISFYINEGESLGIVGESGCGKSVTMKSIIGLLDDNAHTDAESIMFNGQNILNYSPKQMRKLNGSEIGMIFQDPMTSLNPVFTIEQQFAEPLKRHLNLNRKQIHKKALEMLEIVGIPMPKERLKQYPHELSGGLRQRVMIAIALCCNPRLLIADEPTTALDVTIQAQILELMEKMKKLYKMSVVMISHDLGVISTICTRVLIMYGGKIMEEGSLEDIFYKPMHPYTAGLLLAVKKNSDGRLVPIKGTPPDLLNPPKGCPFAPRCKYAMKICMQSMPGVYEEAEGHSCSCWLYHPSVRAKKGDIKIYE